MTPVFTAENIEDEIKEVILKFNLDIDRTIIEKPISEIVEQPANKEDAKKLALSKQSIRRVSNTLLNRTIAFEQGIIDNIGGRIFGQESLVKKQEFDRMIRC